MGRGSGGGGRGGGGGGGGAPAPATLTGTPRQVAWATDIRSGFNADVNGMPGSLERLQIYKQRAAQLAAAKPDASWWINNRNNISPRQTLRTLAERLGDKNLGQDKWKPPA